MSHSNSTKAVVIALTGNALISILKFIAGFFTMSASMLAEAIHSTADCFNQIFLLIGNKRSQKSSDENHPFGYGREEFFWAFIVAIMLFFGGALFSIYEGIHKLSEPHPIERAAGCQEVFHFHQHVIPRWSGDGLIPPWRPTSPRGGSSGDLGQA